MTRTLIDPPVEALMQGSISSNDHDNEASNDTTSKIQVALTLKISYKDHSKNQLQRSHEKKLSWIIHPYFRWFENGACINGTKRRPFIRNWIFASLELWDDSLPTRAREYQQSAVSSVTALNKCIILDSRSSQQPRIEDPEGESSNHNNNAVRCRLCEVDRDSKEHPKRLPTTPKQCPVHDSCLWWLVVDEPIHSGKTIILI